MENYNDLFNPSFLKQKEQRPQFPDEFSLAMAYIPLQMNLKMYPNEEGFSKGTVFPELNKPFYGRMVDSK